MARLSDLARRTLAIALAVGAIGPTWLASPLRAASDGQAEVTGPAGASPYGDFLAAVVAEQLRDNASAAEFYLHSLNSDPDNAALLERAFLMLAVEGRFEDAEPLARQVAERAPQHQLAQLVLTAAAVLRGDFDAARGHLEQVGQRGPARIAEPLMRAWLAAEAKDGAGVDAALGDMTGLERLTGRLSVHKALIEEKLGNDAAALAAMEEAAADTSVTSFWLLRIAKNFFLRHGEADRARAIAETFAGQSDSASLIALIRKGLDAPAPPEPAVDSTAEGVATVLFDIAQILSGEDASDGPLFYAHLALWLSPGLDEAHVLIGDLLERQGRSRAAITAYRRIGEASPYHWSVGLRIATELETLEENEQAIAMLEELAGDKPDRFEPYYQLGNLYRADQRFEEAAEAYDKAVARLGAERTPWTLFYFRGIAYERIDHWAQAEADFDRALELEPDQPYVLNYLAYSWIERGEKLDEAKKMLERAVAAKPDDGYIVDSLGWVYYRLKQYDKAAETLEQAIELKPQDPVINDHLGDAYWRTGRKREAEVQWRRALSLEPEDEEVPKIERKLDEGLPREPQDI